ncbi:MAG: carboxypeptidase-like regulatory domain-containing protein [Bacteroidota bacterium]
MSKLESTSNESLLRRYLSGDVGPVEEAELRARALEDEALAEALIGIDNRTGEDHVAAIERLRKQLPQKQKSRVVTIPIWGRIAASILVLVALGGLVWYLPLGAGQEGATAMEQQAADEAEAATYEPQPEESDNTQGSAPLTETNQQAAEILDGLAETQLPVDLGDRAELVREEPAPASAPVSPPPPAPQLTSSAEAQPSAADDVPERTDFLSADVEELEELMPENLSEQAEETLDAARSRRQSTRTAPAEGVITMDDEDISAILAESANTVLIEGFVTDTNGVSISNATVRMSSLPLGEITNGFGYFSMEGDASVSSIIIEAPGYEAQEFRLPQVGTSPGSGLSPRPTRKLSREEAFSRGLQPGDPGTNGAPQYTLNQINPSDVASEDSSGGSGPVSNSISSLVRVEGGMQGLRQRIAQNKPDELGGGRIRVNLTVQPDGHLTDIRVRGGNRGLRDYVEDFLRNQTQWQMLRGETATELSFELRF